MHVAIPQKKKRMSMENKNINKRSDAMSDTDIKLVRDFYEIDDITRTCPGKKETVAVKMSDGSKEHIQKKILMMNVKEAYQVFKKEHSDKKIGKSKFASLRPKHVFLTTEKNHDVCMCQYCENLDMILESAHRHIPNFPDLSSSEAVKQTVCQLDDDHIACIDRSCTNCGIQGFLDCVIPDTDEHLLSKHIQYYQWESNETGYTIKIMTETTVAQAKEELSSQLRTFAHHSYNLHKQHSELRFLKENLNEGELIMHIDFAENYSLKHQKEVMSAHWSCETVTIYTAVIYWKCGTESKHKSYAVVSDDLSHTKDAVAAFNAAILQDIKQNLGLNIKRVHYWSDGAGSQFKNRFNFVNVAFHKTDYGIEADWSFFETAHGKGAVDGVGGQLKRLIWISILQGKRTITDSKGFYEAAITLQLKTTVLFVEKSTILNIAKKHIERYGASLAVPQTHSLHFICPISGTNKIEFARNSPFSRPQVFKTACIYREGQIQPDEINAKTMSEDSSCYSLADEGLWVAVLFDGFWWPGQIVKHFHDSNTTQIKFPFKPVRENKFQSQEIQFETIPKNSYLITLPGDPRPLDNNARFFGYSQDIAKKVAVMKRKAMNRIINFLSCLQRLVRNGCKINLILIVSM